MSKPPLKVDAARASSNVAPAAQAANVAADLQGTSRLVIAAVKGVTDIVEDMHRNISRRAPVVGRSPSGRTSGITGLVYRAIRGVSHGVGVGLDAALGRLARLPALAGGGPTSVGREAVRAAANGILGDYLAATSNPLAITMTLRQHGIPLRLDHARSDEVGAAVGEGDLLILVHGLCMNDWQWRREGHDHGAVLGVQSGHRVLYLHYNSGRHVHENGADFARLLQTLVERWPEPVSSIRIIAHSMGGLVARSACDVAQIERLDWLKTLRAIVFLGTPHHGAPLERAGNGLNLLLGGSPYTAPFVKLGEIRSAGIRDLRHGATQSAPAADGGLHLPRGVKCYAIAASKSKPPTQQGGRLTGDGLVPVASALGQRRLNGSSGGMQEAFPAARRAIFHEHDHFDLLSSTPVCDKISQWLFAAGGSGRVAGKTTVLQPTLRSKD